MQATVPPRATSPQPHRVDYAPRRLSHRLRWAKPALVVASAAVVVLCVCAWVWGPGVWSTLTLLNVQRRCLNAAAPAQRIVYDDDPARSAAILKSSGDAQYVSLGSGRPVAWVSADFARFCETLSPGVRQQQAPTLFVGGLETTAGTRRLVYVDATCTDNLHDDSRPCLVYLRARVIIPGTMTSPPRERPRDPNRWADMQLDVDPRFPFCFFAGQTDPANPSHFTISFERNGAKSRIDGWLKDDESVKLERRAVQQPFGYGTPNPSIGPLASPFEDGPLQGRKR